MTCAPQPGRPATVGASCQHVGMMLRLLGEFRDLDSTEATGKTSRHTGRLLREVEVSFNCGDALTEQLNAELNAAREESAALVGEDDTRWVVGYHSHSSTNTGNWRYTVELRQVEDLRAERLEFLGLTLVPSHYEERADRNGPIVITAQVAPGTEDDETLERHIAGQKLQSDDEPAQYFDLRRVGVQDEPMQVRFGRCLWQQGESGARQHLLVFVSADGDDDEIRRGVGLNEPQLTNAERIAVQGREIAEAIIDELRVANVLSEEALERIRQRGASAWERRFRDFAEARDLSQFR